MKKYLVIFMVALFVSPIFAQEAPKACCHKAQTEQKACCKQAEQKQCCHKDGQKQCDKKQCSKCAACDKKETCTKQCSKCEKHEACKKQCGKEAACKKQCEQKAACQQKPCCKK